MDRHSYRDVGERDVDDVLDKSRAWCIGQVDSCGYQDEIGHAGETVHDGEAVNDGVPTEFDPIHCLGLAVGAERCRGQPEGLAVAALRRYQAPFLRGDPERFGVLIDRDPDVLAGDRRGQRGSGCGAHAARPRIKPLTGRLAGPPVTSASSASGTWLMAVPRICSTPSMMWVIPMM